MNIEKATEEYDQDPKAFELKYGPQAVQEVLKASVHFVPFPTDDKEPKVPSFKEDQWGDTAVWAAKEPFEEAKERFLKAGQGATIEIPETDNSLMRAYMQSLDYAASMGLAGLDASDAAFKFAVGAASELLPNQSNQQERRFTRDVSSLPEAFLGSSPASIKASSDRVRDSFEGTVKKVLEEQDPSKISIFAGVGSRTSPVKELPVSEEIKGYLDNHQGSITVPDDFVSLPRPEDQWEETGWFRGPDEKFRYEIDDSKAVFGLNSEESFIEPTDLPLVQSKSETLSLEEAAETFGPRDYREGTDRLTTVDRLIDHPELFEAYPDLKGVPVVIKNDLKGAAWISPNFNENHGETLWLGSTVEGYDYKEMLLHELQHAVQYRENFFGGGNPQDTFNKVYSTYYYDELDNIASDPLLTDDEKLFRTETLKKNTSEASFQDYETTFGEEEARAVMDRLHMSKNEKKEVFPYYSHLLSRRAAPMATSQKESGNYEVIDKLWLQGVTVND